MDKIRVLIVDDHPLMRETLGVTIETEADIDAVGVAVNGQEAVTLAAALKPDVVLMDLYMPVMDGIEATRQIKLADPSIYTLNGGNFYFLERLEVP
jgi:DNA-binding NarL/FixJ family response regulator